jgi:aspartate aminotransferase
MTISLANRVQHVKPSATLALAAHANQLKAAGKDIINLTVGEPDFDTPEHIKEAARRALRDGFTKYTPVEGTVGLKQAVAKKFQTENNLQYELAQIIVSSGAKQSIYNLVQVLLNPGDEVIIPAPYWVSYPDMVLLAEAQPVFIETTPAQHFKITAAQLEQAITPQTRLLIINSPSNPSGMVYAQQELKALAEVLLRHPRIIIATDDMYEHIYWGAEPFVNIVNVCPELYDRTVVINGASKAYAMTGWRIGYAAGPQAIIKAMGVVQSQSTSNPNSIAQVAAQAALEGDQQCVRDMNKIYHARHEVIFNGLNAISGIHCLAADGAFYSFPSIQKILDKNPQFNSDAAFAEHLLNEAGIAVVPGSAFGTPDCLRLSFATSMENLEKALGKLRLVVGKLNN